LLDSSSALRWRLSDTGVSEVNPKWELAIAYVQLWTSETHMWVGGVIGARVPEVPVV
jgi:hypothetical protein